jgi:hypothetical protein
VAEVWRRGVFVQGGDIDEELAEAIRISQEEAAKVAEALKAMGDGEEATQVREAWSMLGRSGQQEGYELHWCTGGTVVNRDTGDTGVAAA